MIGRKHQIRCTGNYSTSSVASLAETLSSLAIAVDNNRYTTSQHASSFDRAQTARCPCPGLYFDFLSLSYWFKRNTPENFDCRYYCITMKVPRYNI